MTETAILNGIAVSRFSPAGRRREWQHHIAKLILLARGCQGGIRDDLEYGIQSQADVKQYSEIKQPKNKKKHDYKNVKCLLAHIAWPRPQFLARFRFKGAAPSPAGRG